MAYTTIKKPSDYFNTKLYTGTGSSQNITGVGFQPDFTWLKSRSNTDYHALQDAVRGVTKQLATNTNGAETSYTNGVTAFGTDGFTVDSSNWSNRNGGTFASWNWLAGTAVSGNTGGSGTAKTYTGSVNTTSGFSIIKYTGNGTSGHTIPHHLGVAPSMIITKIISGDTSSWYMYHKSLGNTGNIFLDTTSAVSNSGAWWNSTTPTSSVFTVGDQTGNNSNNNPFIAYCFTDVQGYSKFGSYVGSTAGGQTPFIYTGFAPKYIMVKDTTSVRNWHVFDTERDGYGKKNHDLKPNLSSVEQSVDGVHWYDYLSNGFKVRMPTSNADYSDINASGNKYIYMAFAEQPLVGDNPATAR